MFNAIVLFHCSFYAYFLFQYIKVTPSEDVLPELYELRSLDISEEQDGFTFDMFIPGPTRMISFLKSPCCLPHLVSLDISGKKFLRPQYSFYIFNGELTMIYAVLQIEQFY